MEFKAKGKKYNKTVVFFIDILGFKSIIEGHNIKSPDEIIQIFKKIENHLDSKLFGKKDKSSTKKVIQFSDSIIISFKYNEPSRLFYTLINILHLQLNLAAVDNVLIRGACEIGEAIHYKNLVFGSVINKSYELETNCAIYPRIIIAENIINECSKYSANKDHTNEDEKGCIKDLLKQDTDGFYYIDYFSYDVAGGEMDDNEDWASYMYDLKSFIETGLKEQNVSIKQKYLWLKDKYNKALTDNILGNYKNKLGITLERIA